ncbi:MAG: hypothetical protein QF504_04545 [Nitrospinaceae bacterium]|jgi:hypothetical protein|nr:hypothetical protein [Nitrospinaceae bacterium]
MRFVHFIELLLIAGVLIAIGIPLFTKLPKTRPFATINPTKEEYNHLLVRKEEVLLSIRELEIDFKTDKISDEDYENLRKKMEGEAMETLERIEQLEKESKKGRKSTTKNFTLA